MILCELGRDCSRSERGMTSTLSKAAAAAKRRDGRETKDGKDAKDDRSAASEHDAQAQALWEADDDRSDDESVPTQEEVQASPRNRAAGPALGSARPSWDSNRDRDQKIAPDSPRSRGLSLLAN